MKPKRLFQVYGEKVVVRTSDLEEVGQAGPWRWRLIATRNGQIVGGSQEAFDNRSNALRAARREASFYAPGMAAVEVAP